MVTRTWALSHALMYTRSQILSVSIGPSPAAYKKHEACAVLPVRTRFFLPTVLSCRARLCPSRRSVVQLSRLLPCHYGTMISNPIRLDGCSDSITLLKESDPLTHGTARLVESMAGVAVAKRAETHYNRWYTLQPPSALVAGSSISTVELHVVSGSA